MWWLEILPSVAIITVATLIPQYTAYYITQWKYRIPMRRSLTNTYDINMNLRDTNLHGQPWIRAGLEQIPDK